MEEVEKRGKKSNNEYKLYDLGAHKNEIIEQLKILGNNDLEDMVFRTELNYSELKKVFDMKYIDTSTEEDTLPPGLYEVSVISLILKN